MRLLQGIDRKSYRIIEMDNGQSFTQRLQAMGLVKGTKMVILGKKRNGTMLLMVRGFRLALGAGITRCIQVEECNE